MKTRTQNPFPTETCDTDGCDKTVPKSTRGGLCTACSEVRQLFGKRPNQIDTVSVERGESPHVRADRYVIRVTVDGETNVSHFNDKELRDMRYRERLTAKRLVDEF